ncbi:MAG: GTP cyclohydrolase I FolE [Firmicutes bacterium]|nr:GTP cyclohydrolase I FolE [Bacillota bacterium]
MKKPINQKKIEKLIRELIIELGDNPDREGLAETPARVASSYTELFEGIRYTNDEIAQKFDKCFEHIHSKDLVLLKDIEVFSFCEHHLALMYNMKVHVGYIPNEKVIGLSKIARICDLCAKRLQLQERLGQDIMEVLQIVLNTEDIIVVIEAEHSCMTARGIKSSGAKTRTASIRGLFESDSNLRAEVYQLIK